MMGGNATMATLDKQSALHQAIHALGTLSQVEDQNRLGQLREIASVVNAGGDLSAIRLRAVSAVCQDTPWSRSGIMALDRLTGFSERIAHHSPDENGANGPVRRWALDTSPTLRVVDARQPIIIEDAQE